MVLSHYQGGRSIECRPTFAGPKGPCKRVVDRPGHPDSPWVHLDNYLCILRDARLEAVPPPAAVTNNAIGIAAGRSGGLWVAFETGVARLDDTGRWEDFHSFGGLLVGWAAATREDRRGNVLVGTPTRGLFCLSPGGQTRNLFDSGEVPFRWIRDVLEDRQGSLFLAEDGEGVLAGGRGGDLAGVFRRSPEGRWRQLTRAEGLVIAPGRQGRLWAGLGPSGAATGEPAWQLAAWSGQAASSNPRRWTPTSRAFWASSRACCDATRSAKNRSTRANSRRATCSGLAWGSRPGGRREAVGQMTALGQSVSWAEVQFQFEGAPLSSGLRQDTAAHIM